MARTALAHPGPASLAQSRLNLPSLSAWTLSCFCVANLSGTRVFLFPQRLSVVTKPTPASRPRARGAFELTAPLLPLGLRGAGSGRSVPVEAVLPCGPEALEWPRAGTHEQEATASPQPTSQRHVPDARTRVQLDVLLVLPLAPTQCSWLCASCGGSSMHPEHRALLSLFQMCQGLGTAIKTSHMHSVHYLQDSGISYKHTV